MDVITLAQAKKYAKALIDALGLDVEQLGDDVELLESDVIVVDADGDLASTLIMNRLRQHIWENEASAPVCEEGQVTLTNNQNYPFNNSQQSIALVKAQRNTSYAVIPQIMSIGGNIGEIVVSDKLTNGFKLAFTGSATSVVVKYIVIGGIIS